jgi:hypothetical protein
MNSWETVLRIPLEPFDRNNDTDESAEEENDSGFERVAGI